MLLEKSKLTANQTISITGSKSESNRLLILQKLFGNFNIENLSNSEDTQLLQKALEQNSSVIDVHHAGTAMRFLTAYFAIQPEKKVVITGSERLQQRPIKPLVDALRELGAEINYIKNEGYPPLEIIGKEIKNEEVKISAEISSQFITALLLIAGKLENGLKIELLGEITSRPYLEMSLEILSQIGIETDFKDNIIKIKPFKNQSIKTSKHIIESDWSSASYFYSMVAIGKEKITLNHFRKKSMQGDSVLVDLFSKYFGVKTLFSAENQEITLVPDLDFVYPKSIKLDLNNCPDIAQTLCVTASALGIGFEFSGLKTLKIKETDRLVALQNELLKIGVKTEITDESIKSTDFFTPEENIKIETYNDHRMAMSFAPFSLVREIKIENPAVVEKSYPDFWKDFSNLATKI